MRYDGEMGLYWLAVRAYDPTLGRFISHDPLNRAPLMGWSDQPYAYAGNNPLRNTDPTTAPRYYYVYTRRSDMGRAGGRVCVVV